MNTCLNFEIETKTLKEHIRDAGICAAMRKRIYAQVGDREERSRQLEIVSIAELNANIAILCEYYRKGVLRDVFQLYGKHRHTVADSSHVYIIDWGNINKMNHAMSMICKMLSALSVDNISKTAEKTSLYHELTEIIDASRKSGRMPFLLNVNFWEVYFDFYKKYHAD